MQRMTWTGSVSSPTTSTNAFLNTWENNVAFGAQSVAPGVSSVSSYTSITDPLYQAAFLPSGSADSNNIADRYSNPLIPRYEYVVDQSNFNPTLNPPVDGWYPTKQAYSSGDFASFYGIPIQSKFTWNSQQNRNFTITSSYMIFYGCTDWNRTNQVDLAVAIEAEGNSLAVSDSGTLYMSMTTPTQGVPGDVTFASAIYGNTTNSTTGNSLTEVVSTKCYFNQTFSDAQTNCEGFKCFVTAVRRTPQFPAASVTPMRDFSQDFINAAGVGAEHIPTLTEAFILNGLDLERTNFTGFDLSTVPLDGFASSLAMLFNTYWLVGFGPQFYTGRFETDTPLNGVVVSESSSVLTDVTAIWYISWGWLSVLFISSVILLVAGIASCIWDAQTVGPDVLGFASSIARNNKYINIPTVSSAVGGAERAKLLADVRVMMQDVRADKEVGKIALGTVSETSQKLQPGRLYR